jgi:hypothetical protein
VKEEGKENKKVHDEFDSSEFEYRIVKLSKEIQQLEEKNLSFLEVKW